MARPSSAAQALVHGCLGLASLATAVLAQALVWRIGQVGGDGPGGRARATVLLLVALAVGATLGGRLADRGRQPLRLAGLLVLATAAWGYVGPDLLDRAGDAGLGSPDVGDGALGGVLAALRLLALALLGVAVPGLTLGAVVPALVRSLAADLAQAGRTFASLWGVAALGAALGTALAWPLLVAPVGLGFAAQVGASGLALAGFLLLAAARWRGMPTRAADPTEVAADASPVLTVSAAEEAGSRFEHAGTVHDHGHPSDLDALSARATAWHRRPRVVLASAVLAGAVAGLWLTVAERMQALAGAPPVHATTAALSGLVLGAAVAWRLLHHAVDPWRALAWTHLVAGAATVLLLPVASRLSVALRWLALALAPQAPDPLLTLAQLGATTLVLALPLACVGAIVPLTAAALLADVDRLGHRSSVALALPWAGAAATLAVVPALLPHLGLAGLLLAAATLAFLAATALVLRDAGHWLRHPRQAVLAAGPALIAIGLLLWPAFPARRLHGKAATAVAFARDDAAGSLAVFTDDPGGVRRLFVDGAVLASTSEADRAAQALSGAIGLLLLPAAEGTAGPLAVTHLALAGPGAVAASLAFGDVRVTLAAPAGLLRATGQLDPGAAGELVAPRIRRQEAGARQLLAGLRLGSQHVVVGPPAGLGQPGQDGLPTAELLDLVRSRLRPEGLYVQRLHLPRLDDATCRRLLDTLVREIGPVTAWRASPADVVLVAGRGAQRPDLARLSGLLARPALQRWLATGGPGLRIADAPELLARQVLSAERTRLFFAGTGPLLADDRPLAPRRTRPTAPRLFDALDERRVVPGRSHLALAGLLASGRLPPARATELAGAGGGPVAQLLEVAALEAQLALAPDDATLRLKLQELGDPAGHARAQALRQLQASGLLDAAARREGARFLAGRALRLGSAWHVPDVAPLAELVAGLDVARSRSPAEVEVLALAARAWHALGDAPAAEGAVATLLQLGGADREIDRLRVPDPFRRLPLTTRGALGDLALYLAGRLALERGDAGLAERRFAEVVRRDPGHVAAVAHLQALATARAPTQAAAR